MKKIYHTLLSLLTAILAISASAQSVSLGIAIPSVEGNIDRQSAKGLATRLQKILSNIDIADCCSDFVVVPKVTITDESLIESGMKNIYTVKLDLSLEVLQLSTGKVFGSTIVDLEGSGMRQKSAALKNAMGSIRTNNPELEQFFTASKNRIITYYEANSASIISKAIGAANRGYYEQAFAILSSYPQGIKGWDEAENALNEIYARYSKANCEHAIRQAESAIAIKNYNLALSILSEIDPYSDCSSQATQLISTINGEVRQAETDERDERQRRENLAADIINNRINAARDVAKSYYQRTYPDYIIL